MLEDRHNGQDEAVDILAENLQLLAEAVEDCADMYEEDTADFAQLEAER